MSEDERNVFQRLTDARDQFHKMLAEGKVQQSGYNSFIDAHYYELKDLVAPGLRCLHDNGLCLTPMTSSGLEASMEVVNAADGNSIQVRVPVGKTNLKSCHDSQNVLASSTYARRNLWLLILEVTEPSFADNAEPEPIYKPTDPATEKQMNVLRKAYKAGKMDEDAAKTLGDRLKAGKPLTIVEASALIESLQLRTE